MDPGLVGGRVLGEPVGDAGQADPAPVGLDREGVGDPPVGVVVVVAERLAVAGDRHEVVAGPADDAPDHDLAGEAPERDVVADRAVVDHQVDAEGGIVGVPPPGGAGQGPAAGFAGRAPRLAVALADRGDLAGRQDREPDPLLGQDRQRAVVDRGLGQPEAVGGAAEAVPEVGEAPADLGAQVAVVAERQDGVAVPLGDRPAAGAIGVDDAGVGLGGVLARATT